MIEGFPAVTQMIGFGLAILAIWIMSCTGGQIHVQLRVLTLPVVAGLGFVIELGFLDGRARLAGYGCASLVRFE